MATLLRVRWVPFAAMLISVGCAGGDTPGNLTSFTSFGTDMPTSDGTGVTTFDSNGTEGTGVMTSDGSDDGPNPTTTGPDPDTGDTGPDPDTGDTGPGCVPVPEECNGMDDDCDGVPDNGDPGAGEDCNTGMSGVCADGVTSCEAGEIACNPVMMAMPETCNGEDDDCNGEADDGNPGGGGACNTGMPGVCSAGTNQCSGGAISCVPDVAPGAESCNGQDDDCDGVVDDGNPGGGGACNTGMPGVCGPGTQNCQGGALACVGNVGPGAEVCGNGTDDDCDGVVDNGCGGGGCPFGLCDTPGMPQTNGCDPCVTSVCAVDAFCCNTQWDAICVGQVETVCMKADCVSPNCAHLVCDTGVALTLGCHGCVDMVCAVDAFCCSNSWDGICVGEVTSVCGLSCP